MSFTDQKPFPITADNVVLFRRGRRFNCALCGHIFVPGDTARWVYANGTKDQRTGNFFVCDGCDGDNSTLLEKAKDDLTRAIELAKRWDIYGPDWERQR